ncbi:hypothetical protein HYX10_03780 [Candidatus Woesearchaeota archaeon]|nr:hypothetical protein [Candidatus Woesearchaeota archaeon]
MPVGYLETTGLALLDPLTQLWNKFVEVIPGILAASVVIVVGYIIAAAFGLVFHRFLEAIKVDEHLKKAGLSHSIGFINLANLGGAMLKWYVFALFIVQAASFLRLGILSDQLVKLAGWLPSLFAAVIIMLVGLILSDMVADRMLHAKRKGVRIASGIVRWFAIIFVALIAIEKIGINVAFATNAFLILIGGVALGAAIALGLGFGFALKDEAKGMVKQLKKNW